MLVGSEFLEEFIDHMERDDLVRRRWLKRIREKDLIKHFRNIVSIQNDLRNFRQILYASFAL